MKNKILIIDDEEANLEFFNLMLSRLGFDIKIAANGENGLNMIKEFKPDLIILDNVMPNLSGWEITRIVKESEEFEPFRDIPIIMFSAIDDVKDKVEGFELGIEDYITKPFNFSEVLARIRAVLRNHELGRQMILREKNQAQMDSLSKSLVYLTGHLKNPTLELIQDAKDLNIADINIVADFRKKFIEEAEKILATLAGLEDEVRDFESAREDAEEARISLEEMEKHFKNHFAELKKKNYNL